MSATKLQRVEQLQLFTTEVTQIWIWQNELRDFYVNQAIFLGVISHIITCSDETENIILIYEEDNFITASSKRKPGKSCKVVACFLDFACLFGEQVNLLFTEC